jgi:hypothetical protein
VKFLLRFTRGIIRLKKKKKQEKEEKRREKKARMPQNPPSGYRTEPNAQAFTALVLVSIPFFVLNLYGVPVDNLLSIEIYIPLLYTVAKSFHFVVSLE